MKVKSNKHPDGFDYVGVVQVLKNPFLKFSSEPTKKRFSATVPAANPGT
jgi:hypothetical protein